MLITLQNFVSPYSCPSAQFGKHMEVGVEHLDQNQVLTHPSFPAQNSSNFPMMHPDLMAGMVPSPDQQSGNKGPGIYAVPVMPITGPVGGVPTNMLIPLRFRIPARPIVPGTTSEEHGQEGRQPLQAPQRQIVGRRFQFPFHVDLLLLLKLVAVIFVFNHDESWQRLVLLILLAAVVYLYQTGFLTPLIRSLTNRMHMVAAPPQPRPVIQAENGGPPITHEGEQPGAENQPLAEANELWENENQQGMERDEGLNWWRIVKEVQIVVMGFVTSLLPGFHNVE